MHKQQLKHAEQWFMTTEKAKHAQFYASIPKIAKTHAHTTKSTLTQTEEQPKSTNQSVTSSDSVL